MSVLPLSDGLAGTSVGSGLSGVSIVVDERGVGPADSAVDVGLADSLSVVSVVGLSVDTASRVVEVKGVAPSVRIVICAEINQRPNSTACGPVDLPHRWFQGEGQR